MIYGRLLGVFLIWGATLCIIMSCGNQEPSSELKKSSDDGDLFVGPTTDENGILPELPRTRAERETTWHEQESYTNGLETSFSGTTFSAKTNVDFYRSYSVMIWLFAPDEMDVLTDDEGVFLNNAEDRPFVYLCRYTGQQWVAPAFEGKVSMFGNGAAHQEGFKDRAGVVKTTERRKAPVGGSFKKLFEECMSYGEKEKVKASIDRDLAKITKSFIFHDELSTCVTDNHCSTWHKSLMPGIKDHTVPVCRMRKSGTRACDLRSKQGGSCPLFGAKSGERLTPGLFEYQCAEGLSCNVTQKGGWFRNWTVYSSWKGECK